MESAGESMEEIYALPPKLKYNESWLEIKEKRGFKDYWVVLKGNYMFFFKDQNTHLKEQHVGYLPIEVQQTKCNAKKGSSREFILEMGKKKYNLRATDDILRKRWVYAIELVNRANSPGPLPGDLDFEEIQDNTPSPNKMKQRAKSVATIPTSHLPSQSSPGNNVNSATRLRRGVSLNLKSTVSEFKNIIEEDAFPKYDSVFIPPSWYFGNISRQEAEKILADQSVGRYLLRDSNRNNSVDHYALSIKDNLKIKHHRIVPLPSGKYQFESLRDMSFATPIHAIEYLLEGTYPSLQTQPVCMDKRRSGDGQEVTKQEESPRHVGGRKLSENPYATNSPNQNGSPSTPSPTSPPPLLPSLRVVRSVDIPHQTDFGRENTRKARSLPGTSTMKGRPLPDLPSYANSDSIRLHQRGCRPSYINVEPTWNENEVFAGMPDTVDVPPPLPRKKVSLPAGPYACHIYENLQFHAESGLSSDQMAHSLNLHRQDFQCN